VTNKTIPDMKEIFRQAAEIAQQVPENMQVAAFNRALDLLTGSTDTSTERNQHTARTKITTPTSRQAQAMARNEQSTVATLMASVDTTQHPAVASTTRVLDRALIVLQIALRNHQVDGLTPPEIAKILTDKFRLNTSRQAVSMALGSATILVNRVPRGSSYEYRIMGPGEEYLTHLGSDRDSPQKTAAQKPVHSRRRAKRSAKANGPLTEARAGAAKSKRPGPKQILETLIAEKFFDSPRDIGQMIDYIRHQYARTYKATDLSPALTRLRRADKLDRTKNDKDIYEYVVHR
jgi:hypothetical protein